MLYVLIWVAEHYMALELLVAGQGYHEAMTVWLEALDNFFPLHRVHTGTKRV
jgi:hypothetical protein